MLILSGGISITNQDNIPHEIEMTVMTSALVIYYCGVNYHDLVSSHLYNPIDEGSSDLTDDDSTNAPPSETNDFHEKVKELHIPLYPGCKNYFRLSFIIELYLIKSRGKMSDITFGEMVHLLKKCIS